MIPLPKDIVSKDVHQWLENGYFYVHDEESCTYKICRLLGTNHGGDGLAKTIDVEEVGTGKTMEVKREDVFPHWPECGAINIPQLKFAVALERLQKKQWKRTYNSHCIKLRIISDEQAHFCVDANSMMVVQNAFSPEYYTYSDVVNYRFKDGWKSCAISPALIVMKTESGSILVFSAGDIIGTIDGNQFTCVHPGIKRRLLPQFDYMVE